MYTSSFLIIYLLPLAIIVHLLDLLLLVHSIAITGTTIRIKRIAHDRNSSKFLSNNRRHRGNIDIFNTHIHDHSRSCLGTHTSINSGKFWLLNILALSVPNEGYSRNASFALSLIFTFLFALIEIVFWIQLPLLMKWCGHASFCHMLN